MFNKHRIRVWICYKRKKGSKKQVAFSKENMRERDTGSAHENLCLKRKAPESWRFLRASASSALLIKKTLNKTTLFYLLFLFLHRSTFM